MGRPRPHHRRSVAGLILAATAVAVIGWLWDTPAVRPTMAAGIPNTTEATAVTPDLARVQQRGSYVLLAWNDLGMHCISPRFAEMAILPPYNNLHAVVIRRGDEPQVVTSGVRVSYALDSRMDTSKTDFWTYAPKLFGKRLPLGVGLTGNGFSGSMKVAGDHYEANGIPALPYGAAGWNPYQTATVALTVGRRVTNVTRVTVPVSDEMNCVKCHAATNGGTVDSAILALHDAREKTNLMAQRPVLCASCHSDNALGTSGTRGVESLSLAMHGKHASLAAQPACYDCHPGAKTQCSRSAIVGMGPAGKAHGNPMCTTCHGTLTTFAANLKAGRQPWLQEPTCVQCHKSPVYDTRGVLFRNATGHGGVACIACHNSPHAWLPSLRAEDETQVLALQSSPKAVGYQACNVCHTGNRTGTMPPHGGDD